MKEDQAASFLNVLPDPLTSNFLNQKLTFLQVKSTSSFQNDVE